MDKKKDSSNFKHQTHILVLHNGWQVEWTNVTGREHRSAKLGFVCSHQVSWRYENGIESHSGNWTAWTLDHLLNCDWWPFYVTLANAFPPGLPTHWMCFIFHFCSTSTLITRFYLLRYAAALSLSLLHHPCPFGNWCRSVFFLDFVFFFYFSTIIWFHIRVANVMRNVAKWNRIVWVKCLCARQALWSIACRYTEKSHKYKETKSTDETGHLPRCGTAQCDEDGMSTMLETACIRHTGVVNTQSKCDRSKIHGFYF